MARLTRDEIRGLVDLPVEVVVVPEWGDTDIRVRGMTGRERDQFEGWIAEMRGSEVQVDMKNARARLVVLCCVDEAGEKIFELGDEKWLGDKSGAALDRIATVAMRLSGMGTDKLQVMLKN